MGDVPWCGEDQNRSEEECRKKLAGKTAFVNSAPGGVVTNHCDHKAERDKGEGETGSYAGDVGPDAGCGLLQPGGRYGVAWLSARRRSRRAGCGTFHEKHLQKDWSVLKSQSIEIAKVRF